MKKINNKKHTRQILHGTSAPLKNHKAKSDIKKAPLYSVHGTQCSWVNNIKSSDVENVRLADGVCDYKNEFQKVKKNWAQGATIKYSKVNDLELQMAGKKPQEVFDAMQKKANSEGAELGPIPISPAIFAQLQRDRGKDNMGKRYNVNKKRRQ